MGTKVWVHRTAAGASCLGRPDRAAGVGSAALGRQLLVGRPCRLL